MKRQFKFIFLNLLIFLFGCSLPDTTTESLSKAQAIDQVSIQLVSYTTTLADVKVSGQLPAQGTTLINTVSLFSNSMCVGTSLKTGLSSDFKNTGFVIQLPVPQTSSIYLKTNTLDNCFYLGDFIFSPGQNLTPSFNRFDPQSPSTLTLQPLIFGQAWPNTQVKFYSDLTCATLIGQGSDTEFRTSGIYLQIQAQTTNHIYSQVVDVLGNTSSCTLLSDYVHSPVVVDNPVFGSTDPTTPSKSSVTPLVKGAVNSTATDIELYSDTGCVNLIGSGTQTDFQSSGIQINTTANSSTTVYARAKNSSNQLSSCTFLTIYTHDSVAPADPIYLSADPTSPTRLTIFPLLKGQLSADASSVRFFTSPLCLASANIGTGSKYEFESTGVPVTVLDNNITSVYAQALDAAGNSSNCVFMVSYKHNTIPPLPPTITGTIPESPNNVTASPVINGVSSENTKNIYFYSDDQCLSQIGTSTATAFDASGSLIHTPSVPNSINATTIYTRVDDIEGNLSDCISVALYEYSTAKAADPSLLYTIPASPSRTSYRPWVIGTAPSSVTEIGLYSDNNCQTQLGVTSRVQFSSQGIQSILPQNTTSPIYSKTKDKYGNTSDCNILTTYTHDTYKPINPSFVSTNPLSPNNTVMNPLVIGSTINSYVGKPLATTKVHLYDSFLCLTKVGSSNVTAFNNSGITAGLSPNTLNTVYAQTADDAGNLSDCTFMTNYVYTTKKPGVPVLSSTVPASPSYSEKIKVFGQIGYTDSVLAASTVKFFKDSICSQNIGQGAVNDFTQSSGVAVTVDLNQMTDIYGQTYDAVGNKSDCVSLSNFKHYNLPPQNLQAVVNQNGSVTLTWQADQISSPSPKYIIKRSTQSGGPYSVISWTTQGNQFIDLSVQRNKTYYYVVAATNITGHSQDSNQASASIAAGILGQPISLQALAGPSYVDLSWIGSPSSMEYEVLRSTISGGPYTTLVDRLYTTNYSDKSVVNGQIYYYRVVSKNQAGSLVSSAEVSALPLGVSSQNPIQLKYTLYNFHPNCPGKAVFLSWTAPSYYTNFQIRAGLGYSQLKIVQVSSGSNTLICLSTYNGLSRQMYFDVQAVWGGGTNVDYSNQYSNAVAFWSEDGNNNFVDVNVQVYPGNNVNVIKWDIVNFADTYDIWRSNIKNYPSSDYQKIASDVVGTSYVDNTAVNNTEYFYYVVAKEGVFESWPSLEQSGIPRVNPSNPVNLIAHQSTDQVGVKLSWAHSDYANYYNVYRASATNPVYSFVGKATQKYFVDSPNDADTYYYYVKAVWGGSYETAASNIVTEKFAPQMLISAISNSTQISISFMNLVGVSTYKVYRSTVKGGPYTEISTVSSSPFVNNSSSPVSYPVNSSNGYYYIIRPVLAGGTLGTASNEVSGVLTTNTATTGLTATDISGYSVTLEWIKNNGATLYNIYKATSVGGPYTIVNTLTAISGQSYVVSSLSPNTTYYFKVANRSCNTSCMSPAVTVLTVSKPSAPVVTPSGNAFKIDWTTTVGGINYNLLRSTDGVNYSVIQSNISTTPLVDSTVSVNTIYFYKITSSFSDSSVKYSDPSLGLFTGLTPAPVSNLILVENSNGTDVTLTWSLSEKATKYNIYISTTSPAGPWALQTSAAGATATLFGLTTSQIYYFKVKAAYGETESPDSNVVKVIPLTTPTAPLITMAYSGDTTTAINLNWTALPDATTYDVYRSTDGGLFNKISTSQVATSYTDTVLNDQETYYYYYVAKMNTGETLIKSSVAGPIDLNPVMAPTDLRLVANDINTILLQWTSVPIQQVIKYNIYRSTTLIGGYSLIATVPSSTLSYIDNGALLSSNTTYYYYIRSVNLFEKESLPSNTVFLKTVGGPTLLSSISTNSKITLNWNQDISASSYELFKGIAAGGPYTKIADLNSTITTFDDTSIKNAETYFYVIRSVFASGITSYFSNETSAVGSKVINIKHPIELVDLGLSTEFVDITFERTRTSLDTDSYDGIVSYSFAVVASNLSSSQNFLISLISDTDTQLAQITVPPNTNQLTRFETGFTPDSGFHTYRVKISALSQAGAGNVSMARIWVDQKQATKSKLYYPLTTTTQSPVSGDQFGYLESISSGNYTNLSNGSSFKRRASQIKNLAKYSPWELEVVSSTNGSVGLIGLMNENQSQIVAASEILIDDTSTTMINSSFADENNFFGNATNNQSFTLAAKCYDLCDLGSVNIYKAGLWVNLTDLSETEVFIRTSVGKNYYSSGQYILSDVRSKIDLSAYSNPVVSFVANAQVTNIGFPMSPEEIDIRLMSSSTSDNIDFYGGLTDVLNSTLVFTQRQNQYLESSIPLSLISNDRYIVVVDVLNDTRARLKDSFIVIKVNN